MWSCEEHQRDMKQVTFVSRADAELTMPRFLTNGGFHEAYF